MIPAMFCSRCGAQLVPDAAFCAKCGAPVVLPPAPAPQTVPPPPPPPFVATSATSGRVAITRPGVVTFLAVLHFMGAAFWILVALGALAANGSGADPIAALVTAPVVLVIGLAQLFCGIGLMRLRPYGRTLQLVFAWIGLIGIPIGTVISILILVYFFKPGVKLIFAGRPGDDFTDQELAAIKAGTASSGAMIAVIVIAGVLLAVMVIAIIAAIAVPGLLRARMSGNEATAIASLRSISTGEESYAFSCASGGFAVALEDLAKPPTSGGSGFISANLREGGVQKSGYVFTLTRDSSPLVIDISTAAATCNGSTNQPASSYFASAEPVNPGVTGTRYFAVDARGTIYESNHPISNPIMNSTGIVPIR